MTDKLNLQRLDHDPRLPMRGSIDFERVLYVRLYELFRAIAGVTNQNGQAISDAISNVTTQLTEDINQAIAGAMQKSANLSDLTDTDEAKDNLGLGNVDNTSDMDKPISSAAQTELDKKVDKANNLSDLQDTATARDNLGLGTAAIADVVGTMANGTIIERGSNANGEYVKFADGSQIAVLVTKDPGTESFTYGAGLYRTNAVTFQSPASFVFSRFIPIIDYRGDYFGAYASPITSASQTSVYRAVVVSAEPSGLSSSGRGFITGVIIGRWK